MFLDAATGYLSRWSLHDVPSAGEVDRLITYLGETADMLEPLTLATRNKPWLIDGALVLACCLDAVLQDQWQPWTG
ncbi:hypothetical protein ACIF8T_39735 [Streptomyces sp. NPDC085946]|uniref:hypothetical protein n=1 Tax=Streptomyces sp. NPDC085946 TaxID=3365744 RepID=UPI0037D5A5C6